MNKDLVRKVVAQYLGNNTESVDVPWMDYLERKGPSSGKKDQNDPDYQKEQKKKEEVKQTPGQLPGGDGDVGPALMDGVNDGLSLNKEQDVPPANENDSYRSNGDMMRHPTEMNKFDRQTTPETSLKHWWDARDRQDEATGNVWGSGLYGHGVLTNTREAALKMANKTVDQILAAARHPKTELFKLRGKALRPTKVADPENEKRGLYTFKVPDGNGEKEVKVQFLKTDRPTNSLLDHPCQVACDCNAFLFWGPQFYAVEGNYMYMPMFRPQLIPPRPQTMGGRGRGLTFCTHLYSVVTHISEMGIDDNYGADVLDKLEDISDNISMAPEDQRENLEKFNLDRKTKFVQFLEDPNIHRQEYLEALKAIKENGLDEHVVADYVNGEFSTLPPPLQKAIIRKLAETPSVIVLILLEYKMAFGKIPQHLIDIAYKTIKDKTQ